jgi:hypothetical protein
VKWPSFRREPGASHGLRFAGLVLPGLGPGQERGVAAGSGETGDEGAGTVASSKRTVTIEVLVFGGLLPLALLWWVPAQSLRHLLPLLFLSPLLLGLRHGFIAGTGAAAMAAAALVWIGLSNPDMLAAFPGAQIIGLMIAGMSAGEARDLWIARVRRLEVLSRHHQTRLSEFTHAYHLLQVSHAQLEQRIAGGENNLRTALERLKKRESYFHRIDREPLDGLADSLLDIMVEQAGLYAASVYALNERGMLRLPAVARAGNAPELSIFNPMLREALQTGTLTSVHPEQDASLDQVLAIVPLVDSTGHIHGVVSIHDMPFNNVNELTFELLGVLGTHMGNILAHRPRPMGDTHGHYTLRESLQRQLADVDKHGLPVALVACKVLDVPRRNALVAPYRDAMVALCLQDGRGLDQSWTSFDKRHYPVVVKLMPLTPESGARAYLARMQSACLALGAPAEDLVTWMWMLDRASTADDMLAKVYAACDIEAPVAPDAAPAVDRPEINRKAMP